MRTSHISSPKNIQSHVKLNTAVYRVRGRHHSYSNIPNSPPPVLSQSTSTDSLQTSANVTHLTVVLSNRYRYSFFSVDQLQQIFSSIATRAVLYVNVLCATQFIRGQSTYRLLLMRFLYYCYDDKQAFKNMEAQQHTKASIVLAMNL